MSLMKGIEFRNDRCDFHFVKYNHSNGKSQKDI